MHDEALAEDLVQETFIQLYQRIRQFDEIPFEPCLMRSILNAALDKVREYGKSTSLAGDPALLDSLLEQAASVESQIELAQRSSEIFQALSKLSARQIYQA